MNERFRQVIYKYFRNQSRAAEVLGYTPQQLSRIINGHDSISLQMIEALKNNLPKLNLNFLLMGEGDMEVKSEAEILLQIYDLRQAIADKQKIIEMQKKELEKLKK